MRVLVGFSSRFGSTREVAGRIGEVLSAQGCDVDVRSADEPVEVSAYDALVFGCGVYDGSWTPSAIDLLRRNAPILAQAPLWLFSVGSFGDRHPLIGRIIRKEPREIGEFSRTLRPRGYRVFAGVVDVARWPGWARLLFKALGGRRDNRDWPDIQSWAMAIAASLNAAGSAAAEPHERRAVRALRWRSVRATRDESSRTLPGDEMIADAVASLTHGVTIARPPREVWPWLVQMGAGNRGGWYSYDALDNGRQPSTRQILPERQLTLGWRRPDGTLDATWTFVLAASGSDTTRLLVRVRGGAGYRFRGLPLVVTKPLIRLVHFLMERRQLLGIATRVEAC